MTINLLPEQLLPLQFLVLCIKPQRNLKVASSEDLQHLSLTERCEVGAEPAQVTQLKCVFLFGY